MGVTTSLNPSSDAKTVQFVGADLEGKIASFRLQVKTPDMASDVVDKIKREVEELKRETA